MAIQYTGTHQVTQIDNTGSPLGTVGNPVQSQIVGTVSVDVTPSDKTLQTASGTASSSGNNTLIAAVASKRIKVIAFALFTTSTVAVTATLQDGAGGTALWTVPLQALTGSISGCNLATSAPSFLFGTSAGNLLNLNLSGAISVIYSLTYFSNDAT